MKHTKIKVRQRGMLPRAQKIPKVPKYLLLTFSGLLVVLTYVLLLKGYHVMNEFMLTVLNLLFQIATA